LATFWRSRREQEPSAEQVEAGREGRQVTGRTAAYRGPDPTKPGRFFGETGLVVSSDSDDLMSYPVPDRFAGRHFGSRLCPSVTDARCLRLFATG